MTSSQIDALVSPMEATMHAEEVPQPSSIKIRFKKGTIFARPADGGTATAAMSSQLPIRLSPGSEKRKVAEGMGFEIGEHVVSDISSSCKTRASERTKNIPANPHLRRSASGPRRTARP
jgi:hypothetical protein